MAPSDERSRIALAVAHRVRSGYAPSVKVREVIRALEADGWILVATTGSHRQFKHPSKPGRVTVSGSLGDDMPKGTLASVRRQAQIRELR